MNILFIDVDGVLNTYNYFIKNINSDINIDRKKVKILKQICDITNSKVVLSSAWKEGFTNNFIPISENAIILKQIFDEENIPIIGRTPTVPKINKLSYNPIWKEYEIKKYLDKHNEINHFCIIDDETIDLKSYINYLVQTEFYQEKEEDEGLNMNYLPKIKKILKK